MSKILSAEELEYALTCVYSGCDSCKAFIRDHIAALESSQKRLHALEWAVADMVISLGRSDATMTVFAALRSRGIDFGTLCSIPHPDSAGSAATK